MKTKKHDFVELDFTARANGMIFDTTNKEDAKKLGVENVKPMIACIGEGMVVRGFDEALEDKELSKNYSINLKPEEAFGKRISSLIKTVPLSAFSEMPRMGMFVNVNNMMARVVSLNSGRILLDFNNPLAGKDVVYEFKISRIISDMNEKANALAEHYNLELEKIEIKENKIECSVKSKDSDAKNQFKKKVKELLKLDCEFI